MYLLGAVEGQAKSLERLRMPGFGEKVRFTSIKLLNGDGAHLQFGDPLDYALGIHAEVRVTGVSIGSSIFDQSGSCVGTICNKDTFSLEPREELNLRLVIRNLNLAPGTYYAGFGIGHGGSQSARHDLDVVIGVPVFRILPIAGEKAEIMNWHPNWGSIVISDFELKIQERKSTFSSVQFCA